MHYQISQNSMDKILGSSRAHNIWQYLNVMHPHPEALDVYSKSSAKLAVLQDEAYAMIRSSANPTNCDIYFVGGYCDITHRDFVNNWRPYGVYDEVTMMEGADQCTLRVCNLIDSIVANVQFMGARPCFATIPPASLEVWNSYRMNCAGATRFLLHTHQYPDMQEMLIGAVDQINEHISQVNGANRMATPDLAGTIRERREGKETRTHYSRLHDGVHPGRNTRVQWARKLQKAINRNRGYDTRIPTVEELIDMVG